MGWVAISDIEQVAAGNIFRVDFTFVCAVGTCPEDADIRDAIDVDAPFDVVDVEPSIANLSGVIPGSPAGKKFTLTGRAINDLGAGTIRAEVLQGLHRLNTQRSIPIFQIEVARVEADIPGRGGLVDLITGGAGLGRDTGIGFTTSISLVAIAVIAAIGFFFWKDIRRFV